MENLKRFPEWKHAVDKIANRVDAEGYGFIIRHDELLDYFFDGSAEQC